MDHGNLEGLGCTKKQLNMLKRYSWLAKAYKTIKSKADFEKKGKTQTGLFLEVQAKVQESPSMSTEGTINLIPKWRPN